jgi:hypothetical protein
VRSCSCRVSEGASLWRIKNVLVCGGSIKIELAGQPGAKFRGSEFTVLTIAHPSLWEEFVNQEL